MRAYAVGLASLLLPLLAGAGCSKTLKKIGSPCAAAEECGSTLNGEEIPGDCRNGVCTRVCYAQAECPQGFDCGRYALDDAEPVCYAPKFQDAPMGGYGADCSTFYNKCGAEDPCAAGFECRSNYDVLANPTISQIKCDPSAVCTKPCKSDVDCPLKMFCGTHRDEAKFCTPRGECADCLEDSQCPSGHVCATDKAGGRYCVKSCKTNDDCNLPQESNQPFEKCVNSDKGRVCFPSVGVCRGASPIKGFAEKAICSPCRVGVVSDCGEGLSCFEDKFTQERFCTRPCTVKKGPTADTCPKGSYCYPTKAIDSTNFSGFCTGQSDPKNPIATCYPE